MTERLTKDAILADLKTLIAEVLGQELPPIADDTPILDFVLSSLALVDGLRRIYEHFGVLVSIRRVIEGQATIGGIATYIELELSGQGGSRKTPVKEGALVPEIVRTVRVAPSQQHVAFLSRYSNEAAAAFNEIVAIELEGTLDGPALQAALDAAVARYESLRTSLSPEHNELRVQAHTPVEIAVTRSGIASLEADLQRVVGKPFLPGERLFRVELLRIAENRAILVLVSHALVVDREALHIVLAEIADYYSAYTQNAEPEVGFPALQWTDYLAVGEAPEAVEPLKQAQAYWQQVFADGVPHLDLPGDHPRPAVKQYAGGRIALPLGNELAAQLADFSRSQDIPIEEIILGAYAIYLGRLSGQHDLVIGVRSQPLYLAAAERVVAQTRNRLPVRLAMDRALDFAGHLRRQAATLDEAQRQRHLSLSELIQVLGLPRDQSRSAVFTAAFHAIEYLPLPAFGDLQTKWIQPPIPGSVYDLELGVVTSPDTIKLVCDFSSELFTRQTVRGWLDGMLVLLRAGLTNPGQPSSLLPVMDDGVREKVLHQWNRSETAFPRNQTILDLFADQAAASPDIPAVRGSGLEWSYRELAQKVEQYAAQLIGSGVKPGDRVAVLLDRTPELVAALLSAWRVGAIYVPLDLAFPDKRIQYMLEDAGAKVVITSEAHVSRVPAGLALLFNEGETISGEQVQSAKPADTAIILYTSGSTGQPKGVAVRHAGLVNVLLSAQSLLGFEARHIMLAITTISFDISTCEIFMPLITGGTVEIAPAEIAADGIRLAELIGTSKPDYMQATPSTWKVILAAGWPGDKNLAVAAAGEPFGRELAEQLLARCRAVFNLYGPSETTVYSVFGQVLPGANQPVPIGRPVANTRLYVLDDQLQPVPPGAIGELYIGGVGVSEGYWGQPAMTADRFIPDPFGGTGKLYRAGDLVRYQPDGQMLCLGRIDDQVKIHGVRIELGEVEAALRSIDGVRDAIAAAWRDSRGDLQLVGHIILEPGAALTAPMIRARLRLSLPEVMVPPQILFTDSFPMTANGKIRRADLVQPGKTQPEAHVMGEPPHTQTERQLAAVWARLLEIDKDAIGRDADFMELGGHSLLMTHLMLEVRQQFAVVFSMRELFAAATLRSFARLVDERKESGSGGHAGNGSGPVDREAWGRQRMAFLKREAELPAHITPPRGMVYTPVDKIRTVFMTGATGFLGAYLVTEILETTDTQVYCLVRPKRGEDSKARIEKQMRHYALWRDDEAWQTKWRTRLHVVEGDVTLPRMGIEDSLYDRLARETDAILHGAAHVNFIYPYEALRGTNVLGVHEIIRFAFHTRIKQVHHLSTAAIWPMGAQYTFYEKDSIEHGKALNLGYDEAKWVGERCLLNAEARGLPVARYRPGEVGGDSQTGRCVVDHFLIACIKGFLQFGAFPVLDIEVDVAPVDYVARAMVYLIFKGNPLGRAFHLTNPNRRHMREALDFLRGLGYQFDELPFETLRDRMIARSDFVYNELFAYQAALEDMDSISLQLPNYDTRVTERELKESGIACPAADEKLFGTYLRYLQEIGFIPVPEKLQVSN